MIVYDEYCGFEELRTELDDQLHKIAGVIDCYVDDLNEALQTLTKLLQELWNNTFGDLLEVAEKLEHSFEITEPKRYGICLINGFTTEYRKRLHKNIMVGERNLPYQKRSY